jgi:inhibitor of KinA
MTAGPQIPLHFAPLGDRAVVITLGDAISESTHRRVRSVTTRLTERQPAGIGDVVPAFASVTVHYDPSFAACGHGSHPYREMVTVLEEVLGDITDSALPPPRVVDIPVCYGGELGPDLESVAKRHELDADEVVRIHAAGDYLVYMVGFMPGFAYLGGLSERIVTPRRSSPRTAVPAGTVGIGGQQTGVYPLESPGGWNLIGRTPYKIFDISREEPAMLVTGDRVRFRPISLAEFRERSAS